VATLQPADYGTKKAVREAIEQLKRFGRGPRLAALSIREMIEAGRR
jgi:hypothetical protein